MYRSLLWKAADRTLDLDEEMQDHHGTSFLSSDVYSKINTV